MSILGQGSAILYGTSSPSNKDVIWAKTSSDNPATWDVIDLLWYHSSGWSSIKGVHYGTSAPGDTTMIWLDTNATPPIIKTYDGSSWLEINRLRSSIKTAGYTLLSSDNNAAIHVESASDVDIELEDIAGDEFACTVSRIGTGDVTIVPAGGVLINGVNGSVLISAQWRSVMIRKIRTNEYLIEGAL